MPTEDSQFRFEILLDHRTFLLEANSQTDLELWVKVIKQAKANYWKGREGMADSQPEQVDSNTNTTRNMTQKQLFFCMHASVSHNQLGL
jgi:hypothetical protein